MTFLALQQKFRIIIDGENLVGVDHDSVPGIFVKNSGSKRHCVIEKEKHDEI